MRVTLVTTGLEHLGIGALSAYARAAGHEVSVVYETMPFSTNSGINSRFLARILEPGPESAASRVLATRPDVVAFSSYTVTHRWSVQVARRIKQERAVPIVFGGPHVSGAPEYAIQEPAIDAVVEGEGEGALLDLLDCAEKDRFGRTDVPNVWFHGPAGPIRNELRPLIQDLDELPYADKEEFYREVPALEREFYVISRRGCPYRCSFCEYSVFPKQYPGQKPVRRRSVEHLMGELKAWKARGRMRKVFIWDAIFTLDIKWVQQFADAYSSEIGLPFECYTHPHAMTREMARQLSRAGCTMVRVGVQTVNSDTLAEMDRKGDAKRVDQTLGYLREFGLPYKLDHILGLPGEGAKDQVDAIHFYNRVRPARIVTHWMTYLPGTTATEKAREEGLLSPEKAERLMRGDEVDGFDGPRLFEGEKKKEMEEVRRLAALLELLPLLPARIVDWLLESGHYRKLSHWQATRQISALALACMDPTDQARVVASVLSVGRLAMPPALRRLWGHRRQKGKTEFPKFPSVTPVNGTSARVPVAARSPSDYSSRPRRLNVVHELG